MGGFIADKSRTTQKYQMFVSWIIAAILLYMGIQSNSIKVFLIFMTFESFFFNVATAAFFAKMSTALPRKAMGVGSGIIQTSGYIAGAISPILIGYFVQITGGSYKTAFITMCAFIVIAGLLALTLKRSSLELGQTTEPTPDHN